jgi:hypothetical protein
LDDAIQAVADFEEIGDALTVYRRWFMHLSDFVWMKIKKKPACFGIAAARSIYRQCSGNLAIQLVAICRGGYIAVSSPLKRQCQERD